MENRNSISDKIGYFRSGEASVITVEKKLDELIYLLDESKLDDKTITRLQGKFNLALEKNRTSEESFKAFEELDEAFASRLEMAESLETLLLTHNLDSNVSKKYIFAENLLRFVLLLTSLTLICLGFALIVMPATPDFEMFTIFHFTTDDGFTLMDLIALLIVFAGVYLFIRSVIRTNRPD